MSDKIELLPCPFCGDPAYRDMADWRVWCSGCGASLISAGQRASEEWNRRAPSPVEAKIKKISDEYSRRSRFADHEAAAQLDRALRVRARPFAEDIF